MVDKCVMYDTIEEDPATPPAGLQFAATYGGSRVMETIHDNA
jgi:hypothetical protein